MLTVYLQYACCWLIVCLLYAYVLIVCLLYAYVLIVCLLCAYRILIVCLLYAYRILIVCLLYAYSMLTAYYYSLVNINSPTDMNSYFYHCFIKSLFIQKYLDSIQNIPL